MLKTRARQITKCLRNHKHPLAFEKSLHLGEIARSHATAARERRRGFKGQGKEKTSAFLAVSLHARASSRHKHASDYDTR